MTVLKSMGNFRGKKFKVNTGLRQDDATILTYADDIVVMGNT